MRCRDVHGEEGADGGGNRDAEREIADALAHLLERDDGGDDRAGRRRGHAERNAVDEAHDIEERERRRDEIEEDHEEEERRSREEHAATADEVDEAAGDDAREERADDEEAGREAREADGGVEVLHRVGGGPEHEQEVHRVDEQIDADGQKIIAVPKTFGLGGRSNGSRHDGRLLSFR